MKKLLFIALALMTFNAYAGMWSLINQEFIAGTGWICTYQLQGTSYQSAIISKSYCQSFIYK